MAWNTVHDYINDPAGFEAHHRQWKAQGAHWHTAVSKAFQFCEAEQARGAEQSHDLSRVLALEVIADAARVYMALWRRLVEDGVSFTLTAEGQALMDALNMLDKEG